MKARPLTWLSTAALAATLLYTGSAGYTTAAAPGGDASGQLAGRPGAPQGIARFTAALKKKGFAVQNGQLARMDLASLCCSGQIPTCECNNAGAPYEMVQVPDAPGQAPTGSPLLFRLAANEAIIIVGRTPPPMSYFSVQSFLAWRWDERQQTWVELLAPLGDTVNNLTIRTSGPASDPFDKDTILILTADRGVDQLVQAAGSTGGLSSEHPQHAGRTEFPDPPGQRREHATSSTSRSGCSGPTLAMKTPSRSTWTRRRWRCV